MQAVDATDRTRVLADWIVGLRFAALTPEDLRQLEGLVLDHLGCAYAGARLPWGVALTEWAKPFAGSGKSMVMGSRLSVPATVAGLVNASAAHGMELDDTHDESITHPGAVVIATALAVGAEQGSSGADILTAVVGGYEAMGRAGAATGAADILEKGFHPTALFGGFGAVAAAARLYGMSSAALCEAWGLMLSMAGGSMQFSQDAHGTVVKRLHGGYGAHNGIMAAQLARLGLSGPARALDGVYGLGRLFGSSPRPERLVPQTGEALQIHRISYKPYPCCRLFHSTLDALRNATGNYSTANDNIRKIVVGGPTVLSTQHMLRRPTSMMAAQYSLPFALGASLIDGPYSIEVFKPERLGDSRILALADRVEAIPDAAMEKAFPAHFGSWVEVEFADGTKRRSDVLDSYGTPANPMAPEALRDKFAGLVRDTRKDFDVAATFAAVARLPQASDAGGLLAPFSH